MLPGILSNTYFLERFLTPVMNKAPGNVASILPIEASVITGRSTWAAKRGKLLELQEVILEETTVAAVWLFGVRFMAKAIDKIVDYLKRKGSLHSIYSEADWSKGFMSLFASSKKNPSISMSALERFSNNHDNLMKTMKVKGVKFAIAVAVPLLLCGFVIPRLNQLKTAWIIKKFYSTSQKPGEKRETTSNHEVYKDQIQNNLNQATHKRLSSVNSVSLPFNTGNRSYQNIVPDSVLTVPPPFSGSRVLSGNNFPYSQESPFFGNNTQSDLTSVLTPRVLSSKRISSGPRFGMSMDKAYSWLGKLGHAVDNTHSGSVLAVDVGVTGGRMKTASRRSIFESFEYGARDAGSLFFYLLSIPLIMKLFDSKFGKKMIKTFTGKNVEAILQLDSQIVSRLNQHILNQLNDRKIDPATLKLLIEGIDNNKILAAGKTIYDKLMQAPVSQFKDIMDREIQAFAVPGSARKTFERYLAQVIKGTTVSTNQLEHILKGIWNKEGVLKNLTQADRFHLNNAVKLAFLHTVGMTENKLKEAVLPLLTKDLSDFEIKLLSQNIKRSSVLGGDKVISSMLRRSFNAANMVKSLSDEYKNVLMLQPDRGLIIKKLTTSPVSTIESKIRLIERAVIEGTPIESFVKNKLEDVINEYHRFLKGQKTGKSIYSPLNKQINLIADILRKNGVLSQKELEKLADLLEQNGRTWPKAVRWLQGCGLKNIANEVRTLTPLVDGKTPLSDLMKNHVKSIFKQLAMKTSQHTDQYQLIRSYLNLSHKILKGEGNISVMLVDSMPKKLFEEQLENHLKRIMAGGVKNNEMLYNRFLKIIGHLPMEAEKFVSPHASHDIKKLVNPYLDILSGRLNSSFSKNGGKALTVMEFSKKILEPFAKESLIWRRSIFGLALVCSMLGVGVLIPKLQFLMTRKLTGNNKHPGIAAALSH